jgi:hypothetical protein
MFSDRVTPAIGQIRPPELRGLGSAVEWVADTRGGHELRILSPEFVPGIRHVRAPSAWTDTAQSEREYVFDQLVQW